MDALAALYAHAINHQVTQDPVEGRENICLQEFEQADMTCIVEKIHDAGDVAILEWKDWVCADAVSLRFVMASLRTSADTGTS